MQYTDNPVADFNAYDQECEDWLKRRQRCDWCGKHIQDDYAYKIGDDLVCDGCIGDCRVSVD